MIKSSRYYSPSGRFNLFKLVTALFLLFPLWMISFLYAALLHWNPLTFLSPLIFFAYAIIISRMVVSGINVSSTQNKNIALLLGITFSFAALFFSWANFIAIWQNSYPIQLLEPEKLWGYLLQYFQEGAFTTFGVQLNGYFGLIIWGIEAITLFCIIILSSKDSIFEKVYCNFCNKWIVPVKDFYTFTHPDEKSLIEKVKSQKLDFLDETDENTKEASEYYSIDASCCNTCSKSNYISLNKISIEKGEDEDAEDTSTNVSLIQLRKLSKESFHLLYTKSAHWFHFTESGKYSPWVWLALPLSAAITFVFANVYQWLCLYFENYFVLVIAFIAYIFILYAFTDKILRLFSVRNRIVSAFFGLLAGTLAVYITHVVHFSSDFLTSSTWNPDFIWLLLRSSAEYHEYSSLAYTGLIVESTFIFLAPTITASYISTARVYCEHCDKWAEEEEEIFTFKYPDEQTLKGKFTRQDLSFLEASSPIADDTYNYFRLNAEWCKDCDTIHTLTLDTVEKSIGSEGGVSLSFNTLYKDVIYTHEAFHSVLDYAKKNKEAYKNV